MVDAPVPEKVVAKATAVVEVDDVSDCFTAYLEYNKILRTWFVAFGVGVPALFLVHPEIAQGLLARHLLEQVATVFMVGTAAQVFGGLINEVANWYVYRWTNDEDKGNSLLFRLANAISDYFWIDLAVDLLTIACFGWAAWQLLTTFSK